MSILHVCAKEDGFEHRISHRKKDKKLCPCDPQVLDEGKDQNGYRCQTVIHKVHSIPGTEVPMMKVWVDVKTGDLMRQESFIRGDKRKSQFHSRPKMREVPGGNQ